MGGGVEPPRGTNKPGVEESSQGNETSGVTIKGNEVHGEDGRGQRGDGNSPSTRDNKGSGNTSRGEEMAIRQETAAPQIPQRGRAEGKMRELRMNSNPNGADGARPEYGTLARRKYDLLAPEEPAGNLDAAEPQDSEYSPEETIGKRVPDRKETEIGE